MVKRKTVTFNDKIEVRYYDKDSVINNKKYSRKLFRPSYFILMTLVLFGLYHILK